MSIVSEQGKTAFSVVDSKTKVKISHVKLEEFDANGAVENHLWELGTAGEFVVGPSPYPEIQVIAFSAVDATLGEFDFVVGYNSGLSKVAGTNPFTNESVYFEPQQFCCFVKIEAWPFVAPTNTLKYTLQVESMASSADDQLPTGVDPEPTKAEDFHCARSYAGEVFFSKTYSANVEGGSLGVELQEKPLQGFAAVGVGQEQTNVDISFQPGEGAEFISYQFYGSLQSNLPQISQDWDASLAVFGSAVGLLAVGSVVTALSSS